LEVSNDSNPCIVKENIEPPEMPAGCFSSWLRRIRYALLTNNGVNVPCGECNACCKSSYFIHIKPEETETLARIPKELLFPAPGLPQGNVLLGYDQKGHCPLLVDDKCSIYEHRSITCRNYDCRIFAAAGINADEADRAGMQQPIQRWIFNYPTQRDRDQHAAVKAAARFMRERAACFPGGAPGTAAQLAIVAIKVYEVFLAIKAQSAQTGCVPSDIEIAKMIMEANAKFEAKYDAPKAHQPR